MTQAATWDQQAARAFAAELLAPREALLAELRGRSEVEELLDFIGRLASKYVVSSKVIELQFENAGLPLDSD